MFELAVREKKGPVSLGQISETQGIANKYLEQLFSKLRNAGLIRAMRGPTGGYLLNRSSADITVGDIIRAAEGAMAPVHCVDDTVDSKCDRMGRCVCHLFWERLDRKTVEFLDSNTLSDLCDEARSKGLASGK
jgi:Rrf2 family protein